MKYRCNHIVYESIEGQYNKDMTNLSTLTNSSKHKTIHFFKSAPKSTHKRDNTKLVQLEWSVNSSKHALIYFFRFSLENRQNWCRVRTMPYTSHTPSMLMHEHAHNEW